MAKSIFDFGPLIYGGLACALSFGMFFVGRNAIARLRSAERGVGATQWRLAWIRFLTGSIIFIGLIISATLLLVQVDVWIGLFGPDDDLVALGVIFAAAVWFINAFALGLLVDPKRDRVP